LDEINPPTKLLSKFLRTWRDREKKLAQYSTTTPTPSSIDGKDPAEVALALSRRLIAVVKVKNILSIETGLEMIALAMAISSEVSIIVILSCLKDSKFIFLFKNHGVFPEMASDVKNVLQR
jgi:hypothetical protein